MPKIFPANHLMHFSFNSPWNLDKAITDHMPMTVRNQIIMDMVTDDKSEKKTKKKKKVKLRIKYSASGTLGMPNILKTFGS